MTARLEQIIRPFQEGDVFTARSLPPGKPAEGVPEPAAFSWGKGIDPNFLRPDLIMEFKSKWEEKSRATETVRVENPDDPAQFVDVERIKRLVMRNSDTGEEFEWKMNWPT